MATAPATMPPVTTTQADQVHRLERHRHTTVAELSTSDAEHVGAPRREVVEVADHLRPRGPRVAGIHRERAHHVGSRPDHAARTRPATAAPTSGTPDAPVARSEHGNEAGRAHRPDAERRHLEVTEDAGGQAQDGRDPAPSEAPRAQPCECAEATATPCRRAAVHEGRRWPARGSAAPGRPRPSSRPRHRRSRDDRRGQAAAPTTMTDAAIIAGTRKISVPRMPVTSSTSMYTTASTVQKESSESAQPLQCEIAGAHGVSLQHNGGSVRVSGERVACRHVQDRHQDEKARPRRSPERPSEIGGARRPAPSDEGVRWPSRVGDVGDAAIVPVTLTATER